MKFPRLAAGLVLFFNVLAAVTFAATAPEAASERITATEIELGFREGRVLVKLKAGLADDPDPIRQAAETRLGVSRRQIFRHLKSQQVLEFDRARPVRAAIKELMATGLYEFVEEDRVIRAHAVPNDPSFSEQWSLRNTGQSGGVAGADIGAVAGWDVRNSAASVLVGIMDTGIRVTHTDLAANVWTNPSPSTAYAGTDLHGINATVTPATGNVDDDEINGHGTHVSGIVGAVGNNGTGISGVAWNVRLMGLKFLDNEGSGSMSGELVCFDYAIARGAQIINCSFGAPRFSDSEFAALQRVRDAGIIVVTSAGNDGVTVESGSEYPAGYGLDNIVTVANSTRTDVLSGSSNYSSGLVDLAAPGAEIRSTVNTSNTAYTTLSGTSMAAPHVAGTLALMKLQFPGDTYRELINRLLRSTTKLPALSGKVQSGGRLHLANALGSTDNRPFNDDFGSRAQLAGANVRVRSSNTGASRETGEPTHAGVAGGGSLWWSWTAPSTTTVAFDTKGSSYDTTLAIYTGSAVGSLTSVGSNDNAQAGTTTSRVVLNVTAGITYQIAVESKGATTGYTSLKLGALPVNDQFTNAILLEGRSAIAEGSTLNASSETGEPKHQTFAQLRSVWYRWVAPATGTFQLAAHSSVTDLVAAVYTGSTVSGLTLVVSNDDLADYNLDSVATFTATAGQTYHFAIDDADSEGGNFTVSINDSIWQFPAELEVLSSPAVGTDGSVYFSADDGWLYAVNANGTEKWQRSIGGFFDVASPAIGADGTVYIGSSVGSFQAFNPSTGARKWSFAAGTGISSTAAIANDGTIYFRDDNTLFALTSGPSSATRKWSFPLSGSTYCSPVVAADGTVYVGAANGAFYAVNPDGTEKWRFTADGDIYTSPAIASDGTIYFATLAGKVYALRPDKTQKWVWTMPGNSSVTSSPALGADGTLYFGGYDHKLHALGSDGVEKWSVDLGEEMRASSPAIASDGTIYVGTYNSSVYAISSAGAIQRTFKTAGLIRSSPLITNGRLYFGSSDAKLYAFPLSQNSLSSAWPAFHKNAQRTGQAPGGQPISISAQPQLQVANVGENATFSVTATGNAPVSYQWFFNGASIAGATSSSYTINNAQFANGGDYSVMVTDPTGSLLSGTALLFVKTAGASDARLFAISCRALVGTGSDVLIPGIAIGGIGKQRVVVRAVGPSIQGVAGTLTRPQLQLFNANTGVKVAENTGWDTAGQANTDALKAAFAQTGLSEFAVNSGDSALLADLEAGFAYTAVASGVGGTTGVGLVEVYELGASNARIMAISCRARVGIGGDILIPGIAITGSQPKQLIIRASGPALAAQGVSGALAQLRLQLYNGAGVKIAENVGWSTATNRDAIFATTPQCGLANFPANSADCAILMTLPPGGYTAWVSGLNDTTGVALIEVYEVP